MRTINQIQSKIAKFQAEIADVREVNSAQKEAVHILKNLGWAREKGRWIRPKAKPVDVSGGDRVERRGYLGEWYVRGILPDSSALISEITDHTMFGNELASKSVAVNLSELKLIK